MKGGLAQLWWQILRAAWQGDWNHAAELWEGAPVTARVGGPATQSWIVQGVSRQAHWATRQGHVLAAWQMMRRVEGWLAPQQQRWWRDQKNALVDEAVGTAQQALEAGDPQQAWRLSQELDAAAIGDARNTAIGEVARLWLASDQAARREDWTQAQELLHRAVALSPALLALQQRRRQLADLASLTSRRYQAADSSPAGISVENEVTGRAGGSNGNRATTDRTAEAWIPVAPQPGPSPLFARSTPELRIESGGGATRRHTASESSSAKNLPANFLMWIDGVGGYLVCGEPKVVCGRYVPQAQIDLAIPADLLRRHAIWEATARRGYRITPCGPVAVQNHPLVGSRELRHGDFICLNQGVGIRFRQPDPAICAARLEFVSGHRTVPWCDAVLLATESVRLGPTPSCLVRHSAWRDTLELKRVAGEWWIHPGKLPLSVDGRTVEGPLRLSRNSRLVSDDLSIQLEAVAAE